jgi:hypothetical protein
LRVGLSEEGGRWRWCEFNTSISGQERRRQDEALLEDEADAVSSSWLHRKESVTQRSGVVTLTVGEVAPWKRKGGDDANWVDVNLTGSKNKENLCGRFNCYK